MRNSQHTQVLRHYLLGKKVLVYLFARSRAKWPAAMQELELAVAAMNLNIELHLAQTDKQVRDVQLNNADAVLVLGGDERQFFEDICGNELARVLEKPFVGAASAGVNVFSSYFYSNDHNEVRKGAGLLPIKTICHFNDDSLAKLSELEKFAPQDRLLPLREDQIEILEIA
jgi:hypothetical protein